ncbi:alpha-ketoglutarate-dependent dioxygenase AlkB [Rheinheimera sp.]|uniref:alpha-ketoglutarate-dependent dioxygenase AlkB family protein n=1 Tax=Rheinheimera sp. TaxID=1869214 RepID=UPI00307D9794
MTEGPGGDNGQSYQQLCLPGATLHYWPDWLSANEAQRYFDQLQYQLNWQQPQLRLYGRAVPIPRRQVWMGDPHCSYRYSGVLFEPEPWHPLVLELTNRLNQHLGLGFNAVLLNWYSSGEQHMGWHADDEPELGDAPQIASLSLGEARWFELRHQSQLMQFKLMLQHGSLLLMGGECQRYWQHRVAKMAKAQQGRINLTFRKMIKTAK